MRWVALAIGIAPGCLPADDKNDGLGPCGIDESSWTTPSYNFTDNGLYFGCQPDDEEVFYVAPYFDGLLLSDQDAMDSAAVAVSAWDAYGGWTFSSTYDQAQVFTSTDGLSTLLAEGGFSEIPDRLASKSSTVYNDNNLDCDVRFFTEMVDISGNQTPIVWSSGTGAGYELATTMAHEIGHCLGLGHPDDGTHTTSIMSDIAIGQTIALSNTDTDAIEFLYGPTPTPSSTTPP